MQSFDVRENWQPKEASLTTGDNIDRNFGLPLDLLKEGRNLRFDEQIQSTSAYKAGNSTLPELTLDFRPTEKFAPEGMEAQLSWGSDLYQWGKSLVHELKEFGLKIEKKLENIKPADLLDLAKDLAVCGAKFGPQLGADIRNVVKAKGLDPIADAKLVIDLVDFIKSPEAGKVGEDAMKILREFQGKYGLLNLDK